jgi:hypothetical protein
MSTRRRLSSIALFCLAGLALVTPAARAQVQMADSTFVPAVAHPAFTMKHPRLLFDEAHRNFHTTTGRYQPFAKLMEADGYEVVPNTRPFSEAALAGARVLVIANAAGEGWDTDSTGGKPAFTAEECEAVHRWVEQGGSLLLIADHAPFGNAAEMLANRFGVDMSKGYTIDPAHADSVSNNPSCIVYTRDSGMLVDHPITRGRNAGERIDRIIAFTGQSLMGPTASTPIMRLGDNAMDLPIHTFARDGAKELYMRQAKSAAGRSQGLAMKVGKGRAVVLGEAGMLSAQVIVRRATDSAPGSVFRMGMNRSGIDNRQFALNIMHWLSGVLDPVAVAKPSAARPAAHH